MIVDIPSAEALSKTGCGWLNLAWQIAVDALSDKRGIDEQFLELGDTFEDHERDAYIEAFWRSKTFDLNNSISLIHQSVEILLKSQIAEVSPFLLIANDERYWPKLVNGEVSFYDFRTHDAANLRKIADVVGNRKFDDRAIGLFERLRKSRNRIAHLNNDKFPIEIRAILVDVQLVFKYLVSTSSWYDFRKPLISLNYSPGDIDLWGYDFAYDALLRETDLVIAALDRSEAKTYMGVDKKKRRYNCQNCIYNCSKYYEDEALFVQRAAQGRYVCALCHEEYAHIA